MFVEMHQKLTLEQVLLREVYKKYFRQCYSGKKKIPALSFTGITDFVACTANKFNLKEDELQTTWDSVPEKLQQVLYGPLYIAQVK